MELRQRDVSGVVWTALNWVGSNLANGNLVGWKNKSRMMENPTLHITFMNLHNLMHGLESAVLVLGLIQQSGFRNQKSFN